MHIRRARVFGLATRCFDRAGRLGFAAFVLAVLVAGPAASDHGASIAGRVVDEATGAPIEGVQVQLVNAFGHAGSGYSEADGRYRIDFVDTRPVRAVAEARRDFQSEVYEGIDCYLDCDPANGTPIALAHGEVVSGIDFTLLEIGSISGTVTDLLTGAPVVDVEVTAFGLEVPFVRWVTTGADGGYRLRGLEPGSYAVWVHTYGELLDEAYDDVPCPPSQCGMVADAATPVAVALGQTVSGIDFALDPGATISGTVRTAATGLPVEHWDVRALGDETGGSAGTAADGTYTVRALLPGRYRVLALRPGDRTLTPVLYDDIYCVGGLGAFGSCEEGDGTAIDVAANQAVTGIDFALPSPGSISGRLTDEATGEGIAGAAVLVRPLGLNRIHFDEAAATADDGTYRIDGVLAGRWHAFTLSRSVRYVDEVYDGVFCEFNCEIDEATPVFVGSEEAVSGIDFALERGGSFSGLLTHALEGDPVLNAAVFALDATGAIVHFDHSFYDDGLYSISTLPPGEYFAVIRPGDGLEGQVYDGKPCAGLEAGCQTVGTPISIVAGEDTPGIDFVLESDGCRITDTAMCLNGERFRVRVEWQTVSDAGDGRAVALTPDAGYFWFFNQRNVETVVKVLDNCNGPTGMFWVFAAGLTDQGARLIVTDTLTGVEKVYENPLGTPFKPILDTAAFDTCDTTELTARRLPPASESAAPEVVPLAKGACSDPDGSTLCLRSGRFSVVARWRTPDGDSGSAQAKRLTSDTGYLWFFREENIEVVIKILDNCSGPTDKFWVFAGGLTDLEVELTVTDIRKGVEKTYRNAQRTPFQPILDTAAFDTCP